MPPTASGATVDGRREDKHEEGDGTGGKQEVLLPGGEPNGPDTAWQRTAVGQECVKRVFVSHAPQPDGHGDEEEQPTSRVARLPRRDQCTNEPEAHGHNSNRDVT